MPGFEKKKNVWGIKYLWISCFDFDLYILMPRRHILYSPTVLAATNFMEAGNLASSDSSGGLASRGLVGWLWSKDAGNNRSVESAVDYTA